AQKREVGTDYLSEQAAQVRLDAPLYRRLRFLGVTRVERPPAQEDPRPVAQVDSAQRVSLQPVPAQASFAQSREAQERLVLVISSGILSPSGKQQERLHVITLGEPGAHLGWRARRTSAGRVRGSAWPGAASLTRSTARLGCAGRPGPRVRNRRPCTGSGW